MLVTPGSGYGNPSYAREAWAHYDVMPWPSPLDFFPAPRLEKLKPFPTWFAALWLTVILQPTKWG